ncbi:CGNR zinc finger domain-containing protein [Streptomyces sp. JNUCC 64]
MSDGEPLTGETLALDLINTRPAAPGGRADLLATPRSLARWLALEADRLPADIATGTPDPEDLPPVHRVREHVETVVRALLERTAPPLSALRALTVAQRAAASVWELGWDGTTVTATPCRQGPLGVRLAALLAEDAAMLLAGPGAGGLKECEADGCVMVFLPSHPRRRWCSPSRCGNRTRVARHYRRRSSAVPPA